MGKHRPIFGNLYVGMVKAGESSGALVENLRRVADYLEAECVLRSRILAALTYPITVFVVSVALATMIVQYILPQFLDGLFKDSGINLPWITRVLIAMTAFFNNPKILGCLIGGLLMAGWMLYRHLRSPAGKRQFEEMTMSVPLLKVVIAKILTCRVARTMSALLHAGMLAVPSLELTSEAVDNCRLSDFLKTAVEDLRDGNPLGVAMRAIPIFPPMFPAFVTLGEESGRVPQLMEKAAEIFEQDVEIALLDFTRLIEPVMVLIMGCFVAFILIAVFIPLYAIIGSF
jgi:type II secretory pathway component PulF